MIGYVTVGTNDLERARGFYDALFAEIGARRVLEIPGNGFTLYSTGGRRPALPSSAP